MRRRYRLTDAELNEILECSKPVPYIIIGGHAPESPQEKANRVWKRLGAQHGFVWDSAEDGLTGDHHDLFAEPIPPVEPVVEAIAEQQLKGSL